MCKYHSSVLLLRRHIARWSSTWSVEATSFTHHRNSILTSTPSSSRRIRPGPATFVSGAETSLGLWLWGGGVAVETVPHLEPWVFCCGLMESAFAWGKIFYLIMLLQSSHRKLWGASELQTGMVRHGRSAWNPVHETVTPGDCYRAHTFTVES